MAITFDTSLKRFLLKTKNSEYAFSIVYDKFLKHDFYGKNKEEIKVPYYSFSPYVENSDPWYSLADNMSEFAFFGSGDFRCSSLRMRGKNGDSCTYFEYRGYEIFNGRKNIPGIPFSRAQEDTETLAVELFDDLNQCKLTLYYTVFPEYDIISRYFTIENMGECEVKLEKAMCINLDLPGHSYDMLSLYGLHPYERSVQRVPLFHGNQRVMSRRGASSHQMNPFIAILDRDATENSGEVFGFNFVYSGCFLDEVEVDHAGNTRVGIGLGDENFAYTVEPGKCFDSPEAIMIYSSDGLGEMSRKMHAFIRAAIVPKEIFAQRPVVLNTWEACYFDINEEILLGFAKEGIQYGMDMLVMDDGWFGKRNNERAGLGDWYTNLEKLPDGLKNFACKVKETGMKFGIWIEPEMVNPDSDLYRAHPDWCLVCKGRKGSLSREQLVLDLCNPEVLEYLKKTFRQTFADVPIDYIKWDFNRHLSEVGSPYLPPKQQDEVFYRFQLGVYELYDWFIHEYPNVMIENCSGGGGRYDLAMMALSTQIWTSDNTLGPDRVKIQYGSSIAYPAYVMSCHVSDPELHEGFLERLKYKYHVALGGMLGYELNILKTKQEIKDAIKSQIVFYRKVEDLIKRGDLYRLISPFENEQEISAYYYKTSSETSEKNERILLSFLQNKGTREKKEILLQVAVSEKDAIYMDEISGAEFKGSELITGIAITTSEKNEFSKMWLFTKKE